jgi:hypothetical protein
MRPKKSIVLYCADRELLSAAAFALRLHPYEVTAVDDSRNAAALMMADSTELACGVLIHARQDDSAYRMIHRLLESDLHVPLLLVDHAGDLAPVRYADMVLYGRNTSIAHILTALQVLCARKRRPRPRSVA